MANGSGGTPSSFHRPFKAGNGSKPKKGKKAKIRKERKNKYLSRKNSINSMEDY